MNPVQLYMYHLGKTVQAAAMSHLHDGQVSVQSFLTCDCDENDTM
jgi:hypothetical protein